MKKQRVIGELRLHRDGYGFVTTGKTRGQDVFVPARFVGDALHTDLVEVDVVAGRGDKSEGRIRRIISHSLDRIVGRVEQQGRSFRVISDDSRVRHTIQISPKKLKGARHGQNVVVRITQYPQPLKPMWGEVEEILGKRGEASTEETAVIVHHHLPHTFSKQVLDEADQIPPHLPAGCVEGPPLQRGAVEGLIPPLEKGGRGDLRQDLRDIDFVTIDGETARDFDDAVAVEKISNSLMRLMVSIADVSFYVRPGSNLDSEAINRATSVYFPQKCIPMLPPALSDDLCSLKPLEDRLTMTVEMDVDQRGSIVKSRIFQSVIKSRHRMTYTEVKKILVDHDEKTLEKYRSFLPKLEIMKECFDWLKAKRRTRGSIDFDLPEPLIVIDMTGGIESIVKAERHIGHMMIEEFMISANEAVARFLTNANVGCVYRVHDHPDEDKIREFAILMKNLGYNLKIDSRVESGVLSRAVDMVRGKPEERLINTSLLRSMAQAVYSATNLGHYGLASPCYCHFTSPIRRYPDLVVHRLLKIALAKNPPHPPLQRGDKGGFASNLPEISEHCSRRERIVMEAEREMAKLQVALFMQARIGETYDGIISHVTKFGVFVELKEYFVEGLLPMDELENDRYEFDEKAFCLRGRRHKKTYGIGGPLKIVVKDVDITAREVLFALAVG